VFQEFGCIRGWAHNLLVSAIAPPDLSAGTGPKAHTLVAVAGRQQRPPFASGDMSPYSQESNIYEWVDGELRLNQTLDASHMSVVEDGVGQIMAQSFCTPDCSADASISAVPYLRGATSFHAFAYRGETYLAVAQSLCDWSLSRRECLDSYVQPKSAILQFNKHTGYFGHLLSYTDQDSMQLR
jgi:hypothetical protein